MLFSSITFIYYFLPIVLGVYFLLPASFKNYWLLLTSLFFYFWGEPVYTFLLLFSAVFNYAVGIYIGKNKGSIRAKYAITLSVVVSLLLLGFFKYADFIIATLNSITGLAIPLLSIPLPLGISFYTFQIMTYTIDVYKGEANVQKNPFVFTTYVALFPQLVAGPIVRYTTVEKELYSRTHSLSEFSSGVARFVVGLAKKVLIANQLGELQLAAATPTYGSVVFYWVNAISFALQVYYDFSGYSDMAIGMGRMMGFRFLENFDYPFISKSVSEFWRRWHISLGTFFREYVYIPLGGSRVPKLLWVRNIAIVWFCTGLWHGASWNFAIWGLYFAVVLALEKLFLMRYLQKTPAIFRHVYVIILTMISFVIFQNESVALIVQQLRGMIGYGGVAFAGQETVYVLKSFAVLIVVAIVGCTPLPLRLAHSLANKFTVAATITQPLVYALMLILSTAYLVDSSFNPFLYFRF